MRRRVIAVAVAALAGLASAQTQENPAAKELRRLPADEAHQGVASDRSFVFAIADSRIGKYDKTTGKRVELFEGDPAVFIHMNSCSVVAEELVCALSNFPNLPQISSVEWFSTHTLKHLRSHSFGAARGSMTWVDWHDGSWWICYANYDGRGGDPTRDHNATLLVKYTPQFVEQGSWVFPQNVLERFGHMSASGGRWGKDGFLYVTGHDLPEMYVLKLPAAGARLEYVRTITIPTNGQAFDWDMAKPGHLWTIERKRTEMVESLLPNR
ncbi:MAG: hypothetical protein PW789_15220 [Edaphobacter sp.]|uniref:hypothetical protein n=1 Tax=Edaphobacter sp. TaxID=1934404 RepID=UPI0023A2E59B|nr:hypothetical protein [Edaphobacter sp.]MDE1177929.1 hypothetical protein [Edaphobacter sp.]